VSARIPAIVLAGGRASRAFAEAAGTDCRALADIGGWPMVRYVLYGLRRASRVREIILVAPSGFPREEMADRQAASDAGLVANIRCGLDLCRDAEHALLVTSDLPFLTGPAVDAYVTQAKRMGVDCVYCGVRREDAEAAFPGMRRTYIRTPQGSITGGNVVLQRVSRFEALAGMLDSAHRHRKNPLFLVRMIGARNLARFLQQKLSIDEIGAAVSRLCGLECRILLTGHAELGADVDRLEDLLLARSLLRPPADG
jgi:molybdopterin-guanine dinucleotide biosynthesis protein A